MEKVRREGIRSGLLRIIGLTHNLVTFNFPLDFISFLSQQLNLFQCFTSRNFEYAVHLVLSFFAFTIPAVTLVIFGFVMA